MEFTSVLPGVKLVKEYEDGKKEELFISQNDHVEVETLDGKTYKGTFMQIEFAQYMEEDDILHMHKDDGENKGIPFDNIAELYQK